MDNNIFKKSLSLGLITVLLAFSLFVGAITLIGISNVTEELQNTTEYGDTSAREELIVYDSYDDYEGTGSVIGPTEVIVIDSDGSGDSMIVIERDDRSYWSDFFGGDEFDPWKDYGEEELEEMFTTATPAGAPYSTQDYITLFIETSLFREGDPASAGVVYNYDSNGKITWDGNKDNETLPPNVLRIIYIFDEYDFEAIFPYANDGYTYEGFLNAAWKYPNYCGEKSVTNPYTADKTLEEVCAVELSITFFSLYTRNRWRLNRR